VEGVTRFAIGLAKKGGDSGAKRKVKKKDSYYKSA